MLPFISRRGGVRPLAEHHADILTEFQKLSDLRKAAYPRPEKLESIRAFALSDFRSRRRPDARRATSSIACQRASV